MIWPFATRYDGPMPGQDGSGQWRRIDQGQDLCAPVGTPILAVASGTVTYGHDPRGFGDPYPVLTFDTPIDSFPAVYYGHNHPEVAQGAHVTQGDVIAHTLAKPGGNASDYPGWLELGWWHNGPVGQGKSWTAAGQNMHDHLINAPVFSGDDDMFTDADRQLMQAQAKKNDEVWHALFDKYEGLPAGTESALWAIQDVLNRVKKIEDKLGIV